MHRYPIAPRQFKFVAKQSFEGATTPGEGKVGSTPNAPLHDIASIRDDPHLAAVASRLDTGMDALAESTWTLRQKVALASRILSSEGHWRGLARQITCRANEPSDMLTLGFGVGFDEACASTLSLVDKTLTPVDGSQMPNPGVRFHAWIYAKRPDVSAIVHTHPAACAALSMIGEPLAIAHMDATPLFDDCAFLAEWPGLPIGDDEGRTISEAMGDKHAIEFRDFLRKPKVLNLKFAYFARRELRKDPCAIL